MAFKCSSLRQSQHRDHLRRVSTCFVQLYFNILQLLTKKPLDSGFFNSIFIKINYKKNLLRIATKGSNKTLKKPNVAPCLSYVSDA